jgi:hypothetical protein
VLYVGFALLIFNYSLTIIKTPVLKSTLNLVDFNGKIIAFMLG